MEQIKQFLQKMVYQDNRATAFPFFYVIRTEVEDSAPLESCDFTRWYWQDSTFDTFEEFKKYLNENCLDDAEKRTALDEVIKYGIKKRWENRGMFLTETDAKEHLRLNHYHYSHNAHDYVCHAWRAPELKEFFENLMNHFEIKKAR